MGKFIERALQLSLPPDRSAFLWGPRKVGKTHLVSRRFPDGVLVDLLKSEVFADYAGRPGLLRERFQSVSKTIVIDEIQMGDPRDFRNFMCAVIDKKAFDGIAAYLDDAKKNAKVLAGGGADDSKGYFIEPTLVQTEDPAYRLLCEEIFGPVVTAYVYEDSKWAETLKLVDQTSPYALTGAVFSNDREGLRQAAAALRNSAGNFYLNDKPTAAVVGQQPFGGARASGTNDKAGSKSNLLRWLSPRVIKESTLPQTRWERLFMERV